MKLLKQLRFVLAGIAACALILLVEMTIGHGTIIGSFINQFHPCVEEMSNSAPCYAIYDGVLVLVTAFIAFVLILLVGIRTIKFFLDMR